MSNTGVYFLFGRNDETDEYINLLFINAANIDDSINTNLFVKEIELRENCLR